MIETIELIPSGNSVCSVSTPLIVVVDFPVKSTQATSIHPTNLLTVNFPNK